VLFISLALVSDSVVEYTPQSPFPVAVISFEEIKATKRNIDQAVGTYTCNRGVVVAEHGNVVREFMSGNTLIKICDDYCRNKTTEEVDAILSRISQQAQAHFRAQSFATHKEP